MDDTYITFRYALNIATGHGFVFNWHQFVLGTTTPLWTLILAALIALKIPVAGGALALSLLADIGTAFLIYRLLLKLQFLNAIALGAAIIFLSFFDYFSLARSGMETSFFVFLVLATLHEIAALRFKAAGLLCGLACITRPEGTLLVTVFLLLGWLHRKQIKAGDMLLGGSFLLFLVGGWIAFAFAYFGSVVPQSIVAKAAGAHTSYQVQVSWYHLLLFFTKGQWGETIFESTYLQLNFVFSLFSLLALFHFYTELRRHRDLQHLDRLSILLIFPICYISALALCHAFTWYPWYYGPIYPFLAMLTMLGAAHLGTQLKLTTQQTQRSLGLLVGGLLTGQLAAAILVKLPHNRDFWTQGYAQAVRSIPRSPHIEIAAYEIGAVGWQSWPATVFDLSGLVTPAAVGVPGETLLKSLRPNYLVIRIDKGTRFLLQARSASWFRQQYQPLTIVQDPYAPRAFCAYKLHGSARPGANQSLMQITPSPPAYSPQPSE